MNGLDVAGVPKGLDVEIPEWSRPAIDFPVMRWVGRGKDKKLVPHPDHVENMRTMLAAYGVSVRYNQMRHRLEFRWGGFETSTERTDEATLARIENRAAEHGLLRGTVMSHLTEIATEYHPALEWVRSRKWDGQDRFGDLAETMALAPGYDPQLAATLLRRWLVYCAKAWDASFGRVAGQGLVVLQGGQGQGKTRWFQRMLPTSDWIMDGAYLKPENRDSVQQVCGFAMTELGELDVTIRKQDVAALKAFITKRDDVYRAAYGRGFCEFRRSTAFCGSVNEPEFLADRTGNRRFWVIGITDIDAAHKTDMQQVFAQAHVLARKGEPHWLLPDELAALNESNEEYTPCDLIESYVRERWMADNAATIVPLHVVCESLQLWQGRTPTDKERDAVARACRMMGARRSKSNGQRGYRLVQRAVVGRASATPVFEYGEA